MIMAINYLDSFKISRFFLVTKFNRVSWYGNRNYQARLEKPAWL